MFEPPSKDLIRKLEQFTATRERDLAGCRASVRLLSRDLPTFDTIWLDALVQRRTLTPFQADRIARGDEESLKVGEYFLIDKIHQEQVHVRYLAQHVQTKKRFWVDEYLQPTTITTETVSQLSQLRSQLEQQRQQSSEVLIPTDYVAKDNSLFVVQEHLRGLTARELLIRRGRFPESLVKVITGQLLQQLSNLESAGIVHGEIRISNLTLSRRGTVTILNAGIVPLLSPHWTLHVPLSHESYDGFAPEMIRQGNWTHQADLYSAGCLLWQLACGRSPVYSADSLLKLRTHVSRSIPDVRELAPDIDPQTAQIIYQLTRSDPNLRPNSALALLSGKKQNSFSGGLIRNYVKDFERPITKPTRISPRIAMVTAACLLLTLTTWGIGNHFPDVGMNQLLLSIVGNQNQSANAKEQPSISEQAPVNARWNQAIPLPVIDAQGVLKLVAGKTYRSNNLTVVGSLQIITEAASENEKKRKPQAATKERESINKNELQNAIVLIRDQSWQINSTHLSINNVTIKHLPNETDSTTPSVNNLPPALLLCRSVSFKANQCQFKADSTNADQTRAIAWKSLSPINEILGQLSVSNCQFYSPGTAIMLAGPSKQLHILNCLKIGAGDFLEFSHQLCKGHYPEVYCEQLTLRHAHSFLSVQLDDTVKQQQAIELSINATNNVFELTSNSPGL